MINKIKSSCEPILRALLSSLELNTRSTVGRNLRNIMLLVNKSSIHDMTLADIDNIDYCKVAEERQWRVKHLQHLLEEREDGGLDEEDMEWLDYLCSN